MLTWFKEYDEDTAKLDTEFMTIDYSRFNVERDDCIFTGVMNYARAKEDDDDQNTRSKTADLIHSNHFLSWATDIISSITVVI